MSSLREQILQAAIRAISDIAEPGASGYVAVYREADIPIARGARFALTMEWVSEQVETLLSDGDQCALRVQLSAMMISGERDDDTLDGLIVAAHKALMADRTLGGLCQAIYRRAATRGAQVAEAYINQVTHGYEIEYRHRATDLEVL